MGIIGGAVKLRSGLEGSVLSRQGGRPHLREQSGYSGLIQRPECARGFQRLIEPFHALAFGDHHGNRQIQRVVQALDGCDRCALEQVSPSPMSPIDFMPSTAIPCSTSLGITCCAKLRKW